MEKLGTTPVFMTEEEKVAAFKARKNEAAKRMLQRKADAMQKLIALAMKSGTAEEKAAAAYLMPRPVSKLPNVADWIREEGEVNEDEIWAKFKLGRTEMKRVLKSNEDLTFDAATGTYSC